MSFIRRLEGCLAVMASMMMVGAEPGGSAAPPPRVSSCLPGQVSKKAPGFSLLDLDGQTWRLTPGSGQETWVSFGISGCPWCDRQLPVMIHAAAQFGGRLAVVEVDEEGRRSKALAWQANSAAFVPRSFHLLLDPTGVQAEVYGVQAYPTSFFISPGGQITAVVLGPIIQTGALDHYLPWPLKDSRPTYPRQAQGREVDDRGNDQSHA